MNDSERIDAIQNDVQELQDAKKQKEVQQISNPLDDVSKRIIEELLPDPVAAADYTGIVRFGGDGSDGALALTSGATNINLGGVATVILNYTSLSITGTGSLTFSNPHANGSIVVLKSQGNVTITSSTVPAIDISSCGAPGGGGAAGGSGGVTGSFGNSNTIFNASPGGGGASDTVTVGLGGLTYLSAGTRSSTYTYGAFLKTPFLFCGGGGGSGGSESGTSNLGTGGGGGASIFNVGAAGHDAAGAGSGTTNGTSGGGGTGGGALLIECGGALNITSTINANGGVGGNGSGATGRNGGGGGGGAGTIVILYVTLTANSGTYNTTGGAGGSASTGPAVGGVGGAGGYLVTQYKA